MGVCKPKKYDPYHNLLFKPDRKCPQGEYRPYRVSMDTKHHTGGTYLQWRPHFGIQKRFITILDVFDGGSLHESGELRIKIHRIVTYIYEIRHFFDEVYSSCVTFVPDYQVIT